MGTTESEANLAVASRKKNQTIKCVVWDLDNTLWDGVLLEDEQVQLRPEALEVIKILDSRGILNSIASKNDHATAFAQLERLGISEYFLYPQINWNSKVTSLQTIAQSINIDIGSLAFIDDQLFEREEVAFSLPTVLCIDARDVRKLPNMPEMNPRFVTADSKIRRKMYLNDIERNKAEDNFSGAKEEFLATLSMVFTIAPAKKEDLQRAEELTVRTHQLNTTGYTYSYEELEALCKSDKHKVLIAGLEDKYGTYGKIGLTLLECQPEVWTIKLLLMSCRVVSRGVGTIMITHLMHLARESGVRLQAEFIANERNRMMYITYKFAGFQEVKKVGELSILENDLSQIQPFPGYVQVKIEQ